MSELMALGDRPPIKATVNVDGGEPWGYQRLTVTTVVPLTPPRTGASAVLLQTEAADIRWTDDGVTTPTTALGNLLPAGNSILLTSAIAVKQLQIVSTAGTATVNANFYIVK